MELYVDMYSTMTPHQPQSNFGTIWHALVVLGAPPPNSPDDPSVGVDGPLHVSNVADRITVQSRLEICHDCMQSSPSNSPARERQCAESAGDFIAKFVGVRVFKCPLGKW
jgi:hypothetical protein